MFRPPTLKKIFLIIALVLALATFGFQLVQLLIERDIVRHAFFAGMVAATATAVGVFFAIFTQRISNRMLDTLMGFGAGVMLAASIFSLLPSLEIMEGQATSTLIASVKVSLAILIGAAFAAGDGHGLAIGIAIQDMPEGFIVAMALIAAGYSRFFSISIGVLSGLTEPIMAILGATMMEVSTILLPWGLAAAAGAMLFVISHEIIPESHRKGHEFFATNGLMLGFVLMLMLDTAL